MHSHTLSSLWESLASVFVHTPVYVYCSTNLLPLKSQYFMYVYRLMWRWRRWRWSTLYGRVCLFYYFLVPYSVFACVCVGLNFSVSSFVVVVIVVVSLLHALDMWWCTHETRFDRWFFSLSLLFVYFFLRRLLLLLLLSYLSSFLSVFFGFAKLGWLVFFIFISPRRWV